MTDTADCMSCFLEASLQMGDIAICIKDSGKKVLQQNSACRAICGDKLAQVCEEGCMEIYARDTQQQWKNWGSRVYRNSPLHGSLYDVTLLCSMDRIITFLQPLMEKYEMALAYFREKGLTRRETEIISLTIKGITNTEICNSLVITRSTLRTHLNNIYRKLRESGELPEFIPAKRLYC
jgi:DNA-binding CsgD family transcriptional regulator